MSASGPLGPVVLGPTAPRKAVSVRVQCCLHVDLLFIPFNLYHNFKKRVSGTTFLKELILVLRAIKGARLLSKGLYLFDFVLIYPLSPCSFLPKHNVRGVWRASSNAYIF